MVAAATVLAGRRFQSLTVRWKKEFLYVSLLVLSWKRRCWPLVLLSLCLIYKSLLMSIRLCWILYSMHSLLFCLFCSKLCQPSDLIMSHVRSITFKCNRLHCNYFAIFMITLHYNYINFQM